MQWLLLVVCVGLLFYFVVSGADASDITVTSAIAMVAAVSAVSTIVPVSNDTRVLMLGAYVLGVLQGHYVERLKSRQANEIGKRNPR